MNKVIKRFRAYAVALIFVLLTLLLGIINGINFTMASEDADRITAMLAEQQGMFARGENAQGGTAFTPADRNFRMGPMGPSSPEMRSSVRYFTVAFSADGQTAQTIAYQISAVSEEEAKDWAASLVKEDTGWTRGTYRYRVYRNNGLTYVTVIDQGRELLPSYRILMISVIGEVLFLISSWFVLAAIGRKIYAPLEEADRKQKNFIKNANKELRIPLTVISGNLELIERDGGPNEQTAAVRRQLGKLFELTGKLDKIGVYEEESEREEVSLSAVLEKALSTAESSFALKGLSLEKNIQPDIAIQADPAGMEMLAAELIRNALKYADSWVSFSLERTKDRVILETRNDTDLPDGPADQIFDRFTTLDNAAKEDSGMGLAYVKDIVKAHKGRAAASVAEGIFTLRIAL